MKEIEVKLRVQDRGLVLQRIADLGWRVRGKRELERNYVYDQPGDVLRSAGCLLRVRDSGGACLLTLKMPTEEPGPHKVREEFEVEANDLDTLRRILEGLSYRVAWRYEKYRTSFERADTDGDIVLDETPIGDFLEIEGEPGWIDRTAIELGFSTQDYITATYGKLFEEYRTQNAGVGADMVFSDAAERSDSSEG